MYKKEDQKFIALQNTFDDFMYRIGQLEKTFVEMIEFVDGANDAQLLVKIVDVNTFIRRAFERLETMAEQNVKVREEIFISDKLKPYVVDTSNSLQVVNALEMIEPTPDIFNPFNMRFLKDAQTYAQQLMIKEKKRKEKLAAEKAAADQDGAVEKEESTATPNNKKPPTGIKSKQSSVNLSAT
jgi:hypothetical protein